MAGSIRRNIRFLVGAAYFIGGVVTLVLTFPGQGLGVDVPLWLLFASAYVILSFRSVEVNDRLYASSSVMPLLTAGIAFSLESGAGFDTPVVFAMAAMAGLALFVPEDLRQRRVFQPAANFGQLTVAAAIAGAAIEFVLADFSSFRLVQGGDLFWVGIAGLAGATAYSLVNVSLVSVAIKATYGRRTLLPWSGMVGLFGSQLLMGVLGGILGAVLVVSDSSVVPLILVVYVVGHASVTSYAKLREAHESTLRGFVKTLETRDLYTRGHTERVAYFCQLIGEQLGFTGTQLERMRWAALIHDVGKLAVPVEVMKKRGQLEDEEYRRLRIATHRVDDLLSGVDFLRPMVDIASGCHPRMMGEDFEQTGHTHTTRPNLEQRVLAVADAFDAMTSVRSYRMAFSQDRALKTMREDSNPLYDTDVVDALDRALNKIGERYGPPDLDSSAYALEGAADAHD